ncbi:TetR/AcrR family transcriptional regulator [Actinoplanes sp. NPDC023801]|uniref:TetR/AcrR family transcriptional regulator n=1 Tax=Actinoplanes sp. NPDC023801 TaxID=3154595 RepID=UPI0033F8FA99
MVTTPDRRVRRTRAALRHALLDLMAERGYNAVTVQDIIDRADVGRSTFYNHYTDKDDLLRDGLADLRAIVTQPATAATGAGDRLRFSLPLLRHVYQQRRLLLALLAGGGRTPVLRQVEGVLTDIVRDELTDMPGADAKRIPIDAQTRYTVGAYLALMQWWLTSQPQMPPEEADRIFHTLVAPGLRAGRHPQAPPTDGSGSPTR